MLLFIYGKSQIVLCAGTRWEGTWVLDVVPMMQQLVCVVCVWQLLLGGIIVTGFRRPTSQYNVQYNHRQSDRRSKYRGR